jgi:CHASE2 domain-containing sensor protein
MSWQDLAITTIAFLAGMMLIPQLLDIVNRGAVVNFFTASLTSIILYILSYVFATLGLWFSVIAQSFVATVWLLLAYHSLRNVRDSQFPDQPLSFVARDFFSVWVLGTTFLISRYAERLLRRS